MGLKRSPYLQKKWLLLGAALTCSCSLGQMDGLHHCEGRRRQTISEAASLAQRQKTLPLMMRTKSQIPTTTSRIAMAAVGVGSMLTFRRSLAKALHPSDLVICICTAKSHQDSLCTALLSTMYS